MTHCFSNTSDHCPLLLNFFSDSILVFEVLGSEALWNRIPQFIGSSKVRLSTIRRREFGLGYWINASKDFVINMEQAEIW